MTATHTTQRPDPREQHATQDAHDSTQRGAGTGTPPARTTAVWQIERAEVGRLVSRIFDQGRTIPVLLISAASDTGKARIDPRQFEGRIRAILAVLDSPETSHTLTDTLGETFRAYGGAVRVIWPRASSRDHWRRHRLFFTYPEDDPDETIDRIVEYIQEHDRTSSGAAASAANSTRAAASPAAPLPTGVTPRMMDRKRGDTPPIAWTSTEAAGEANTGADTAAEPAPIAAWAVDVAAALAERAANVGPQPATQPDPVAPFAEDLGEDLGEGLEGPPEPQAQPAVNHHPTTPTSEPTSEPTTGPGVAGASLAQVEAIVARAVRDQVQEVITEMLGGPTGSDETDRERSRADALEQELEDLRRRHNATLTELASRRVERDLSSFRVSSDPAEQLRWEIWTAWLLATPEDARGDGPRPFCFGPEFVASLDEHIIDRAKVVAVCAEVLNRTVHERRTTHPAREGGGGAKLRTRADASTAWRVYLAHRTAGAPRLMFWELKDGGVEFAVAAHHDKFDFV